MERKLEGENRIGCYKHNFQLPFKFKRRLINSFLHFNFRYGLCNERKTQNVFELTKLYFHTLRPFTPEHGVLLRRSVTFPKGPD